MARQIRRVKWYNSDVANETLVNSLVFGSGTGGTCVCAGRSAVAAGGGAIARRGRDECRVLDRGGGGQQMDADD